MCTGSESALQVTTMSTPVGLSGLVSFDVQGQLELSIALPGLCCDMLFVVANIGSDGLLGTEACSPTSHISSICVRENYGLMDGLHCSYTNSGWHQNWMDC